MCVLQHKRIVLPYRCVDQTTICAWTRPTEWELAVSYFPLNVIIESLVADSKHLKITLSTVVADIDGVSVTCTSKYTLLFISFNQEYDETPPPPDTITRLFKIPVGMQFDFEKTDPEAWMALLRYTPWEPFVQARIVAPLKPRGNPSVVFSSSVCVLN